jgi:hypothetical protein
MNDARRRVELELSDIVERRAKLVTFTTSEYFDKVAPTSRLLLLAQANVMAAYAEILSARLNIWVNL